MTNHLCEPRLQALEHAITEAGLDLYLVPMVDEFQGEYIPAYAARLPYVSGFTGSAGMGVFFAKPTGEAGHTLFVDGRYTLQAANEVDGTRVTVLNSGEENLAMWLTRTAQKKTRIGFDPWLITTHQLDQWKGATAGLDVEWIALRPNLVDSIWDDQPAPPAGAVQLHALEFAGRSYNEKRAGLLEALKQQKADALLLTQPDAINWLLNIRGDDIPFNPLLLAYFMLHQSGKAELYLYPHALTDDVKNYFADADVSIASLETIFSGTLTSLASGARVMLDGTAAAYGWQLLADQLGLQLLYADDPTQLPKAIKNTVELEGIRAAHARDGVALTRFLHWFDKQVASNRLPMELEVVSKLESFRAMDATYRGPSFATIAGSGPNGAIIHYRADEASNRKARLAELFLLDSGGQYPGGTTDVTRTLAVGGSSVQMRDHYTRVLKGHIALASAQFPMGTSGIQLDVLARQYLWAAGLDYDHGTGHGVGAYLCVHEGPQRISKRGSLVPLVPGMIVSNEPGYYANGEYGIRIESLVAVIALENTKGRPMLGFETLTLAPIDTRLVELSLLTSTERNWLNQYHARVFKAHEESLDGETRRWLEQATRAI